jgi:hypothetical protein
MSSRHDLMMMCHPYIFALKEGREISNDFFDYSLMLMQRNCSEIVKSPTTPSRGTFMVEPKPMFIAAQKKAIPVPVAT